MLWSTLPSALALLLLPSTSLVSGRACRPSDPCERNPTLSALQELEATDFCVELLGLETVTFSATETVPDTIAATTTVSVTTTIPFTATAATTVSEYVTDEETVDGPPTTVTAVAETTVRVTITQSFTETTTTTAFFLTEYIRNEKRGKATRVPQDAIAERQRQREAQGLAVREVSPPVVPTALREFGSEALSTACSCYVETPSYTQTITVTAVETAYQTSEDVSIESQAVETVTVSVFTTFTRTETTTLTGEIATATLLQTTTIQETVSQTGLETALATSFGTSGIFTKQFSGRGCVQNVYDHYILMPEAYTTNERMFQQCAGLCHGYGSECKSFFAFEDLTFGDYWCLIDNEYFVPGFIQCSVDWSGDGMAYNSPY